MENIDVTLFYKDNFPEEYMLSNEEAVNLINTIKEGEEEFTIKGDTYKTEDLNSIVFPDIVYEGRMETIGIQFNA